MNDEIFNLYSKSQEYILWPIKKEKFLNILFGLEDINTETKVLIEKDNNIVIGFLSTKYKKVREMNKGAIHFIFVSEKNRKRGIGKKLLNNALDWLKENGVKEVSFGEAVGTYFWPGVPENLKFNDFLQNNGFIISKDGPVDMYQDITDFKIPNGVYDTLKRNNIIIEFADETNMLHISEFVKANFPNWIDYYPMKYNKRDNDLIFFAHIGEEIVGVSHLWKGNSNWDMLFENNVGGGGALGVSEKWRNKGIGLAMKCWGTEKLKQEDIKYVWISWTYAIDFYRKLGFKIWRKYLIAKLSINR